MGDCRAKTLVDTILVRPRPPIELEAPGTPSLKSLLTLAVGVVVIGALYFARDVLIPITLAALLSFLLAPLVSILKRLRLGRIASSLIAIALALAMLLALGGLIGTQLAALAAQLPRYQYTIQRKVEAFRGATFDRMAIQLHDLGNQLNEKNQPTEAKKQADKALAATEGAPPLSVEVHQPAPTPIEVAQQIFMPILGPLATTGVVFIVAIFILLQREDLRDRMIRLFGSRDLHRTTVAMNDAARRLSRYFLMQFAINAGFGATVAGGLLLIGIPPALLWGVVGALLRFVPYIGAPLAALFPLVLAAAVDPGWSTMVWTATLYFVLEMTVAQAIEPLLYGRSTGLSPFSVVIAATFWIWLWGPIGLILSTPLTLCMVVLGKHVERLEFLEVLLGDRPPLTPVESFYQRILAGDPDEVEEQAEVILKDCSLSSYYDDVALKGLQLAAYDASRGVLTERNVERIKIAIMAVIDDLNVYEDIAPQIDQPNTVGAEATDAQRATLQDLATRYRESALRPEWASNSAVMCVAGRGPLDEAGATILAQLLTKNGVGARVVKHEDVERARLQLLDVNGVAMICLVYLGPSGTASHLRYLLRRLRVRMPTTPITLSFWPSEDSTEEDDDRARSAIGADHNATSFREVLVVCLDQAHDTDNTAPILQFNIPAQERADGGRNDD